MGELAQRGRTSSHAVLKQGAEEGVLGWRGVESLVEALGRRWCARVQRSRFIVL